MMTKPFDLLALYGRFGREQQVSLKDPATPQAFLADIRVQLDRALTDPGLPPRPAHGGDVRSALGRAGAVYTA